MRMQVKLEIGHKAACRVEPTQEGYTHDWTIFVRGSEGKEISHFVEKVVFHLHESFPRHKRAVKEPPYRLDERGYGSFELKIEVCFKTRDEPRKVMFTYDLFLPLTGYPPVTNVRTEALTFTHPTEDFMKKLIKGGGLQISASNGVGSNGVSNGHSNVSKDDSKEAVQKTSSVPDSDKSKKTKSLKPNSKSGAATSAVVGMKRLPPSHDHTATDGTAKKKKKPSENSSSKSKHSVPVPNDKASSASQPVGTEVKDVKVKFKPIPPKESEKKKDHNHKDSAKEVSSHKGKTPTHSSKGKELKSNTEHASSTDNKTKGETIEHPKTKIKKKGEKPERKSHSEKKEKKEKDKIADKIVDKVTIRRSSGDSWASSGSSGGLMSNVTSKNKALEKMLSEMSDDEEEGENLATPFKRETSPALPKTSPKTASKEQSSVGVAEKAGTLNSSKVNKSKDNKPRLNIANNSSEKHALNGTKENCPSVGTEADDAKKSSDDVKSSSPAKTEEKNGLSGLSKKELCDLYEQIMNCEDSDGLQKVVDIIENTGLYKVSDKLFEFDLCCLEKVTLRKIQKCLPFR